MGISRDNMMRRWLVMFVLLLATITLAVTCVPSWAGSDKRSVVPQDRKPGQNLPQASVDLPSNGISKLRVGEHQTYTRVVLEMTGAFEWSLDQPSGGQIRVLIPGADLDAGIRRIDAKRGLVRSIQPVRRGGGAEILILCESARVRVKTMRLADPERFVIDISLPGADEREPAPVLARTVAPPASPPRAPASPMPAAHPVPGVVETPPQGVADLSIPERVQETSVLRREPGTPDAAPAEKPETAIVPASITPPRDEISGPMTIVLDPGHGGHDTGAIGPNGLMEKDVVLDLAFRLRRLLQDRLGVRVLMTRTEDVFIPLPDRSAFANRARADFMISLHLNGAQKRGAVGFETFFFTREPSDSDARASAQRENLVIEGNGAGKDLESLLKTTLADMAVTRDMKESSNLAERLLGALEKVLQVSNRGVKSGPFYVLATAAMPAVLVESAFITNPREERKLQREDHRQRLAQALFEGIAAYKIRYEQRLGLRSVPAGFGS